ncbi:hypothetical protein ElyMa_003175400 [Elysia marginata]|uniref:CCHC-type domain-containing protein n=1 Tax=Elysia marginata TaxID=1093978 RepID=A0AAV4IZX8_9GAST|nr:hypothetical protein ElyMa_003175400 [Elysia marginata]
MLPGARLVACRLARLNHQDPRSNAHGSHLTANKCGREKTSSDGLSWDRPLHGKTGDVDEPKFFYRIKILEKETTSATVHWIPPTLRSLEKVATAIGGTTVEKIPHKTDQAAIYVPRGKGDDIPHYVNIKFKGEITALLVTVPGRRTKCRHCGDTSHWSKKCPTLRQRQLSRPIQQPTPSYTEKVQNKPPPEAPASEADF